MRQISLFDELVSGLGRVEKYFPSDECAFLALTSKIEMPFRDRLAYALTSPAIASGGRIAREYKRADIAWLVGPIPKAIVELKACYTFNLIGKRREYYELVRNDLSKAANCGGSSCGCFAVLLAVHPRSLVPDDIFDTVKYAKFINRSMRRNGEDHERVKSRATENARSRLTAFWRTHEFSWSLGSYMGIQVDLLGWLIERQPNETACSGEPKSGAKSLSPQFQDAHNIWKAQDATLQNAGSAGASHSQARDP